MKLSDGTPIAADLQADWGRLGGHRCNDPKCPIMVRLAVIERISRSEERERVLREALDKTVWRERSQFPKIPVCVICGAGKEWAAIHGHEPTCALATPAPEPAQPAGQVSE